MSKQTQPTDPDDWSDPAPEYFNEPEACRHGHPKWDCAWCEEDREK